MDDKITPPVKKQEPYAYTENSISLIESKKFNNQIPVSLSTINSNNGIRVPDVRGKSLKKAIKIISNAGLNIKVEGSGQVISQSPKPGTVLRHKDICLVQLK